MAIRWVKYYHDSVAQMSTCAIFQSKSVFMILFDFIMQITDTTDYKLVAESLYTHISSVFA